MVFHKRYILLLVIPIFLSFGMHKFYISFTKINYAKASKAIQITMKVFTDDLEKAIHTEFNIESKLNTDKEIGKTNELIEKYIAEKFLITLNNKNIKYAFLGKEYDNDETIIYLEIENVKEVNSIEIKNTVLMEVFSDQQNILRFSVNDKKKSFILTKEDDKGLLKF